MKMRVSGKPSLLTKIQDELFFTFSEAEAEDVIAIIESNEELSWAASEICERLHVPVRLHDTVIEEIINEHLNP